mmetsp:Transcript_14417/g.36374  ORF Transcript_14417/g.36374 Transcript_14417/m.36374 type:complete len:222 (-) Transcript_14417:862-1527(-)
MQKNLYWQFWFSLKVPTELKSHIGLPWKISSSLDLLVKQLLPSLLFAQLRTRSRMRSFSGVRRHCTISQFMYLGSRDPELCENSCGSRASTSSTVCAFVWKNPGASPFSPPGSSTLGCTGTIWRGWGTISWPPPDADLAGMSPMGMGPAAESAMDSFCATSTSASFFSSDICPRTARRLSAAGSSGGGGGGGTSPGSCSVPGSCFTTTSPGTELGPAPAWG